MRMIWHATLACLQLVWVCPCMAGWISEVQTTARQTHNVVHSDVLTLPAYIELVGLDGFDQPELVIISASTSENRHGRILQVISLGPGPGVRVVTGGAWPIDLGSDAVTTLDGNTELNLDGPRTLLLFDSPTRLIPNTGRIQQFLDDVTADLLDAVTFGPVGSAQTYEGEPVLAIAPGQLIAKPMRYETEPWESFFLIDTPSLDGLLKSTTPVYASNPGLINPIWHPVEVPEPSTVLVCVAGVGMWISIRRRQTKQS